MHTHRIIELPGTPLRSRSLWTLLSGRNHRQRVGPTFSLGMFTACLGVLLLMTPAVQATSFSSAQSGPWNDSATWGGGGFPAAGDNATINNTHTVTVSGNEAVLNLTVNGGAVLTLSGGSVLSVTGTSILNTGTINGSGTFDCQGDINFVNRASVSAALVVSSSGGSLTRIQNDGSALITFDGTIAVASGATLQIDVNRTLIANSDVTVSSTGTLSGMSNSRLQFNGTTLTNNGNISANVDFNRNGAQTLTGTGAFVSNTAAIITGSTVTLGSDHQMNAVVINGGGAMNITSRTLSVSGNSTPITNNGTFTTPGSTIIYNGTSPQDAGTINANWDYNNLTINNLAGVSLSTAEVIPGTLTLTNGLFSNGGNLTMGNGALVSRSNGSLGGAPTFGASVHVQYTQTSPLINIPTGPELPSSGSVLGNLTINNSGGVTLNSSSTVNGTLSLTNGAFSNGANLTMASGTSIQRDSGTLGSAPTFGAGVNVNYVGTTGVTTGSEIPSSASVLSNLTINKSGGVNLGAGGATVNGTLSLANGTFAVGTSTLVINNGATVGAGTLTSGVTGTVNYNQQSNGQSVLAFNYGNLIFSNFDKTLPGATIGIAGAFTPGSAVGHTITGSTVDFNGGGSQTIPAFNYNNLTSSNGGGRTLVSSGTVGVAGAFLPGTNSYTITGSTIDFNGAGAQTIPAFNYFNLSSTSGGARTLAGSGTIGIAGTFAPGAHSYTLTGSTVEFNGSGVTQSLPAAFTTYNNLTLNNSAGTTGFAGLTVNGLLEVKTGTFTSSSAYNNLQIDNGATLAATAGGTINVSGNWTNNGSFTASTGTVNFDGGAAQTIGGSNSTAFNILNVSNTAGGISLNQGSQIDGTLTLTSGALSLGANTLIVNGAISAGSGSLSGGATSNIVFGGSGASTSLPAVQNGLNNLTINRANGIALGANLTVGGTLTLTSGDLTTGSSTLTMPNTATSIGTTDVVGNVKRTGFIAGVPLSFGNPFTSINFQSGTLPADVNINLAKAIPVGFPTAVARTYLITPNGGSGFTATLRLHYLDGERGSNAEGASLSLWRFTGSSWEKKTATAFDTTANWSESNAVTQFSPWTLNSTAPTAAPATISGRITNPDGTPLGGALVTLTGGPHARRAITNAAGLYSFSDVETDGFYTVTPQRANYLFSPCERSFSLLANKTDALFTAAQTMETANPLDTPEFFVRQQYLDFLNREPEQDGLDYWSAQLRQCADDGRCMSSRRIGISGAFFSEREFQQTGSFVYRLYKASLGTQPSYADFSADRSRVVGGATLAEMQQAFADEWVSRDAFKQQYPDTMSAADFVNRLFDTAGLQAFDVRQTQIDAMTSSGKTRAAVLQDVIDIAEVKTRESNPSFVLIQYFGYLHREVDRDGYNFWLDVVNNREPGNYRGMVCAFVTSAEYQRRFSSVVTRTNAECSR